MKTVRTFVVLVPLALLLAVAASVANPFARPARPEPSKPLAALTALPASPDSSATSEGTNDVEQAAREAESLLGDLQATYVYLDGVTVAMGPTPNDEQAVSYYTDGEIVISPDHEAGLDEILAHEIWHVIDWRDNGRLDWGEDLPPSNSSDYLTR